MHRQHVTQRTHGLGRKSRTAGLALLLGMLAALALFAGPALAAPGWATLRLTDNAAADEWPAIAESGDYLVWQQTGSGQDSEIVLWSVAEREGGAITANTIKDRYPRISGDYVVWQGQDPTGDWEVYLYRISTGHTTKLTDNASDDTEVQICGDLVVWLTDAPTPTINVYTISTATLQQPATEPGEVAHPQTDGSWVVWQARRASAGGSDFEIEYWDGAAVHQVTENGTEDQFPMVADHKLVWQGYDGHDYEIYFFNAGSTQQLTDNSVPDAEPLIDSNAAGTWVIWRSYAGLDWEVMLASGATEPLSVTQVTNNSGDDFPTDIQDEEAVWYGGMGAYDVYGRLASDEVVNYSAASPQDDRYPQIGGSVVVWQRLDEEGDWEIYAALPDDEDPEVEIIAPVEGAVMSGHSAEITGTADDNLAVAAVEVRIDAGPWQAATIDTGAGSEAATWHYTWSLPAEDRGAAHVIAARAVDTAANVALSDGGPAVRVDSIGPTVSDFAINGGATQTTSADVTLSFSAVDGSPPLHMRFSNDGSTWSAWEPYTGAKPWALTAGTGTKTVWGGFRDAYGNVSGDGAVSDTILVVAPGFSDVPATHPYAEAIHGMRDEGIIDGYPVGGAWEFRPGNPVFRAQFAKMICGVMELPVEEDDWPNPSVPFTDLGDDLLPGGDTEIDHLYPHEYVAVAYLDQITRGLTGTTFSPYASITRAQVVTMMVRAMQHLRPGALATPPVAYAGTLGPFDAEHGANMRTAEYNELLEGLVGFGTAWDPWAPASRGETAQMLWNLMNLMD